MPNGVGLHHWRCAATFPALTDYVLRAGLNFLRLLPLPRALPVVTWR